MAHLNPYVGCPHKTYLEIETQRQVKSGRWDKKPKQNA